MSDVNLVIANPTGGMLNATVFLFLVALVGLTFWLRIRWVRAVVVAIIVWVVLERENGLYIMLRIVADKRDLFDGAPPPFMRGLRLMYDYAAATKLYSVGCAVLLGALALFGYRSEARSKGTGADSAGSSSGT